MKRTILITLSAVLIIGLAIVWLGNFQNSPTAGAKEFESSQDSPAKELTIEEASNPSEVEMQQGLPGREISKPESASQGNDLAMFYAAPWIEEGRVAGDSDLEMFYAGPWYNGD